MFPVLLMVGRKLEGPNFWRENEGREGCLARTLLPPNNVITFGDLAFDGIYLNSFRKKQTWLARR